MHREGTVMGRQTRRQGLACIGFVTQVHTDRCPLFPYHVIGGLGDLFGRDVPSLCHSRGFQLIPVHHVIRVEVRLTALTDRLTVDEDIEFESWVLVIAMTRRFQNRHVLKQQHRILDRIDVERELNPLRLITGIPVTETDRSQLSFGHRTSQTTGTRFRLRAVEMHHMTAGDVRRPHIDRGNLLEIVKQQGVLRIGVIDITNGIVQVQIIHAQLVRIVDQLRHDRLEAIEIIVTFGTYDKVGLTDRQVAEISLITRYDLRTGPHICVIGIGTDLILRSRTLPGQHHRRSVRRHLQVRRSGTGFAIRDDDVIYHGCRRLRGISTVRPSESQVMRRSVALGAADLHCALFPGHRSVQIVHTRRRFQFNHIVRIVSRFGGNGTGRCGNGKYPRRGYAVIGIRHRNPERIQTVELTGYIRQYAVVEDQIVISRDRIQGQRIIGKHPATFVLVIRRLTAVTRHVQAVVTVTVIITRFSDIPFVSQLVIYTRVGSRIHNPTIAGNRVFEVTRVFRLRLHRHHVCQRQHHHYLDESFHMHSLSKLFNNHYLRLRLTLRIHCLDDKRTLLIRCRQRGITLRQTERGI